MWSWVCTCVCVCEWPSTGQAIPLHYLTPVILPCSQMAVRLPNTNHLREGTRYLKRDSYCLLSFKSLDLGIRFGTNMMRNGCAVAGTLGTFG